MRGGGKARGARDKVEFIDDQWHHQRPACCKRETRPLDHCQGQKSHDRDIQSLQVFNRDWSVEMGKDQASSTRAAALAAKKSTTQSGFGG